MYSDYLSYLKHVDDTTLQDFRNELNKLNDKHNAAINQLNEKHAKILETTKKDYTAKEQSLKETITNLKRELALEKGRYTKYKKTITEQISNLNTQLKESDIKASTYKHRYESSISKLKELSTYRMILVILISIISFGVIPLLYIVLYAPVALWRNSFFSVRKWVQCDQYASGSSVN